MQSPDVTAYLERIGHRGDLTPSEPVLRALHRAHLDVPWLADVGFGDSFRSPLLIAASITNLKLAFYAPSIAEVTRVRVFDRHGQLLQEIDEGIWVGTAFYLRPPLARELGVPGVVLAEPLRVQLERGETPADGEWTLARIRGRWLDQRSRLEARPENGRKTGVATE